MQYNQSEFLVEVPVPDDELIISRTDLSGNITHANELFVILVDTQLKNLLASHTVL